MKLAIVTSLLLLFFNGCDHIKEHFKSHSHEKHHGSDLTLNNGQKWKSDNHTMDQINKMKSVILEFKTSGKSDFNNLHKNMDAQTQILISGCTMTGPDHDELHKFLGMLLPKIESLKTENSFQVIAEIEKLLDQYESYFEL